MMQGVDGFVMGRFTKETFAAAWRGTLETDPDSWLRAVAALEKAGIPSTILYELVSVDSDLSFVRPEDMAAIAKISGLCLEMIFEMEDHIKK